ncbi:uncharacterized protein LOC144024583 [Festucalex cinctus]
MSTSAPRQRDGQWMTGWMRRGARIPPEREKRAPHHHHHHHHLSPEEPPSSTPILTPVKQVHLLRHQHLLRFVLKPGCLGIAGLQPTSASYFHVCGTAPQVQRFICCVVLGVLEKLDPPPPPPDNCLLLPCLWHSSASAKVHLLRRPGCLGEAGLPPPTSASYFHVCGTAPQVQRFICCVVLGVLEKLDSPRPLLVAQLRKCKGSFAASSWVSWRSWTPPPQPLPPASMFVAQLRKCKGELAEQIFVSLLCAAFSPQTRVGCLATQSPAFITEPAVPAAFWSSAVEREPPSIRDQPPAQTWVGCLAIPIA